MRRWMEMYVDQTNTLWYYNLAQAGQFPSRLWFGMPSKSQARLWHNYATGLYAKLGLYQPGFGDPASPDYNYNIVQPWVRYDILSFSAIYPTVNLTLFNSTTTRPLGDWVDPTTPTRHRK